MFRKIFIILVLSISTNAFSAEVEMNFTKDVFLNAQKTGKTVVVNSWSKWCYTCVRQEMVLKEARKDFKDILFLSYAQKDKEIADFLGITHRSTIVVYKNSKEIIRKLGIVKKEEIYSLIKRGI